MDAHVNANKDYENYAAVVSWFDSGVVREAYDQIEDTKNDTLIERLYLVGEIWVQRPISLYVHYDGDREEELTVKLINHSFWIVDHSHGQANSAQKIEDRA